MKKIFVFSLAIIFSMSILTACNTNKEIIVDDADDIVANIVNNDETMGDFTYRYNSDLEGIIITKYTGNDKTVIIPETIDGYPVLVIGDDAFYWRSNIQSITIPDGVITIGDSAFMQCYGLTNINIPDSVTSIGEGAFWICHNLKNITIPNGIKNIEDFTFWGCSSLTSISLPENVISIGDKAFYGCNNLTNITIPDNLTYIWDGSFYGCNSLTEFSIPDGVTYIGEEAFLDCSSLTTLSIPDDAFVDNAAFMGCEALTITYMGQEYNSSNIDKLYEIFGVSPVPIVIIPE